MASALATAEVAYGSAIGVTVAGLSPVEVERVRVVLLIGAHARTQRRRRVAIALVVKPISGRKCLRVPEPACGITGRIVSVDVPPTCVQVVSAQV